MSSLRFVLYQYWHFVKHNMIIQLLLILYLDKLSHPIQYSLRFYPFMQNLLNRLRIFKLLCILIKQALRWTGLWWVSETFKSYTFPLHLSLNLIWYLWRLGIIIVLCYFQLLLVLILVLLILDHFLYNLVRWLLGWKKALSSKSERVD